MPYKAASQSLDAIHDALEILDTYCDGNSGSAEAESLPSLLQQCESITSQRGENSALRTVHHFACTGGTLIAKCLFALPNTIVLSEIDPLSTLIPGQTGKVPFLPTDLIYGLRNSVRKVGDETILDVFLAGLATAKSSIERKGWRLILRDHAHSQFCTDVDAASRPTLREMLTDKFAVKSILTVRHPLDSFVSLNLNQWAHFSPFTLEEYARRYTEFVDRYLDVPVVLYEDFVADPSASLKRMCEHLDLPFNPLAPHLIAPIRLSGDSGRGNTNISPRPRRQVPEAIDAQRNSSPTYATLCSRYGYYP